VCVCVRVHVCVPTLSFSTIFVCSVCRKAGEVHLIVMFSILF
jgi:hypothetical protein